MEKIKTYIYVVKNDFLKMYIELILNISINILNVVLLFQTISINDYEVLSLLTMQELQFVSFSAKCISILTYISMILKNLSLDYKNNACIIFTRITKGKWLRNKFLRGLLILSLLRLPLYIFLGFSYDCFIDILMYLLILISTIYTFTKNDNFSFILFISTIMIILLNKIDLCLITILYIIFSLILTVKTLIIFKNKIKK